MSATAPNCAQNSVLKFARACGPILSPHHLGPDDVSFREWLSWPEVVEQIPADSDQNLALPDLLKVNGGGWKSVQAVIKQSTLYRLRGNYWYCHRIFASIYKGYRGLLTQKDCNRRALEKIPECRTRAQERAERERLRKKKRAWATKPAAQHLGSCV